MVEATKGVDVIQSSHDPSEEEHHEDGDAHHEEAHDEEEHLHGDYDPHVWLDPNRAIGLAENIQEALIDLHPEHKEAFNENFDELKKDLERIDAEFTSLVQRNDHPEILVSHAAYGYWEDAYGIEQLAVAGLSPTDEPSQKN